MNLCPSLHGVLYHFKTSPARPSASPEGSVRHSGARGHQGGGGIAWCCRGMLALSDTQKQGPPPLRAGPADLQMHASRTRQNLEGVNHPYRHTIHKFPGDGPYDADKAAEFGDLGGSFDLEAESTGS